MEEARKREEQEEKDHEQQGCFERLKGKKAEGYLEIFTSFIHNFFDGFALGVGFGTRDGNEYIPILVAVYTHAVPRELGDIAILIKSGFDDCQTTTWSAIPKVMIIPGIAAGVGLQATSEAARFYILTVVAGTFLYIASDIWKNLFLTNNKWKNLA